MSEVANSSASAGVERVVGWAAGGAGVGLVVGGGFFSRYAGSPWPLVSGAVLLALGLAVGFAAFVREGGLRDADESAADDDKWHDEPPRYFAALACVLAFALVFGVMAGIATGTGVAGRTDARPTETVTLPGFAVTVPKTLTVTRESSMYRAAVTGWPPGEFTIEWQSSEFELEALEAELAQNYGRLDNKAALGAGDYSGTLWSFEDRSRYTTVVAGSCDNGPSIKLTVRSESADYAAVLARNLADSIECTAAAVAPTGDRDRGAASAAAVSPVPRFVMPAGFGAVPATDGYAFQSLDGDTLAFRAIGLNGGSALLSGRLEAALAGDRVTIEAFEATAWPEGSARQERVFSFVRVEQQRRTVGLATVLSCPAQGRAYVAVSLATEAAANLERLERIGCPDAGEPAPSYETLLAVAERACGGGNDGACAARQQLAATDEFRVLAGRF